MKIALEAYGLFVPLLHMLTGKKNLKNKKNNKAYASNTSVQTVSILTSACSIFTDIASIVAWGPIICQRGLRAVWVVQLTERVLLAPAPVDFRISLQAQHGVVIQWLAFVSVTTSAGL